MFAILIEIITTEILSHAIQKTRFFDGSAQKEKRKSSILTSTLFVMVLASFQLATLHKKIVQKRLDVASTQKPLTPSYIPVVGTFRLLLTRKIIVIFVRATTI